MNSSDDRLEALLRKPEPAIGDDGFSESVMHALPARRFVGTRARRWTLGGAAVAGGVTTALLAAPLESAFGSLAAGDGYLMSIAAVVFIAIVAVPAVWAFFSE
jgi:hypothetical protein